MIEITLADATKIRVEAAKVSIPGFERFEFYATPAYNSVSEQVIEGTWCITEASTGFRVFDCIGNSIDEAVRIATYIARKNALTPERLDEVIEEAKQQVAAIRAAAESAP